MTEVQVIEVAVLVLQAGAKILGPLLAISLVVGVAVGLVQAVTQVQEFTLTFVPKVLGIAAVLVVGGRWMFAVFLDLVELLHGKLPALLGL